MMPEEAQKEKKEQENQVQRKITRELRRKAKKQNRKSGSLDRARGIGSKKASRRKIQKLSRKKNRR